MLIVMLSRLHAALFDDHKDDEGVADDAEHEDDDVQEDDEAADPCLVNEVLKVSKWSLDYTGHNMVARYFLLLLITSSCPAWVLLNKICIPYFRLLLKAQRWIAG